MSLSPIWTPTQARRQPTQYGIAVYGDQVLHDTTVRGLEDRYVLAGHSQERHPNGSPRLGHTFGSIASRVNKEVFDFTVPNARTGDILATINAGQRKSLLTFVSGGTQDLIDIQAGRLNLSAIGITNNIVAMAQRIIAEGFPVVIYAIPRSRSYNQATNNIRLDVNARVRTWVAQQNSSRVRVINADDLEDFSPPAQVGPAEPTTYDTYAPAQAPAGRLAEVFLLFAQSIVHIPVFAH